MNPNNSVVLNSFEVGQLMQLSRNMAEKLEKNLGIIGRLRQLNQQLLERMHEHAMDSQREYAFLVDLVVKNQIDYEAELYELKLVPRVRGGFIHEAPF